MPEECVRLWFRMWQQQPSLRAGVHASWPTVVARLQEAEPQHRARHIRGPLSAMVALLLDNGWNPQSAISWAMPPTDTGEVIEWQFPDTAWT
eukprot:8239911-Pyramimonas_sp.AAC.1